MQTEERKAEIKAKRVEAMAKAREARKAKKLSEVTEVKEEKKAVDILNEKSDIKWFAEVDINSRTGKPSADYPGWYFEQRLAEQEDEIRSLENALEMDLYKGQKKKEAVIRLSAMKKRHDEILESKPNLRGADKDRIAKVANDLGERIKASMPCYSDMQRGATGSVDIEQEARRMVLPCIEVKSKEEADLFKQRGINIVNGKVSRNQAITAWKIMSKSIGADTCDAESLRNPR
jgi:hypothetical protein